MDGVFMSLRDQQRYRLAASFIEKRIFRDECAEKLDCSERQVSRIVKRVKEKGLAGVKHGNCGRAPKNRLDWELVGLYVQRYREKYFNFNRKHALEMMILHGEFAISISYWAFNQACGKAGLGKQKRRRRKSRSHRGRHPREGHMVQLDGSPHRWFDGKESCLIAIVDDATSKVPVAEFHPSETTWGCMNAMRRLIEEEGVPEFVLTDLAGWSTGSLKRSNFSQFVRACDELDTKVIGTPSAESKGRVERKFRTFQDRLIPELELYGVKSLADANRYLEQVHLPTHNQSLTVMAESPIRAYRAVPAGIDLREVFCLKEYRIVNRDHTVQYKGLKCRLLGLGGRNLWKHEVRVHEYENGDFRIFYDGKSLDFEKIKEPKRRFRLLAG